MDNKKRGIITKKEICLIVRISHLQSIDLCNGLKNLDKRNYFLRKDEL